MKSTPQKSKKQKKNKFFVSLFLLIVINSLFFVTASFSQSLRNLSGWEAFAELSRGNLRFEQGLPAQYSGDYKKRAMLIEKEAPHTVVVTCSDSRVVPEIIFDQGLGDLHVVRTVGLAQDQLTVASVESALIAHRAQLIVFLVSEACSGVPSAKNLPVHSIELKNLKKTIMMQSKDPMTIEEKLRGMPVRPALQVILRNISRQYLERSDLLKSLASSSKLLVAEAVFSLRSGRVDFLHVGVPELKDFNIKYRRAAPKGFTSN